MVNYSSVIAAGSRVQGLGFRVGLRVQGWGLDCIYRGPRGRLYFRGQKLQPQTLTQGAQCPFFKEFTFKLYRGVVYG